MKSVIYAKTTTTYAILMSLPLIIRVILLFTERTNSGKHYPLKFRSVHHYSSSKTKSELAAVAEVNVRFVQDILPMLVIFNLFFCDPNDLLDHNRKLTSDMNLIFNMDNKTLSLKCERSFS